MPKSIVDSILESGHFAYTMSKPARLLRNEVIELCFSNINPNDRQKFIDNLKNNYHRVNWEKAIFYNNNNIIFDGILKRTSKKFEDDKTKKNREPPWKMGTKATGAHRSKNIDWFELSTFANSDFWFDIVEFSRSLSIKPDIFDKMRSQFVPMYDLITDWLLVDFSFSDLYRIYEISKNDSISFVRQCMDKVDDRSKISVPYLMAIIEKERAILKAELADSQHLTDRTKMFFDLVLENEKKWEHINWDELDKEARVIEDNMREFDKVKLS